MLRASTLRRLGTGAFLAVGMQGCNNFLQVDSPGVIDVRALDPVQDAGLLSGSAVQNFAAAYALMVVYSGWFAGEIDVSSTFAERIDFARHAVEPPNVSFRNEIWTPLSQAAAHGYLVLDLDLPNPGSNVAYVRAHHALAWSLLFMAEQFCRGVVLGGPPLTTAQLLDSAVVHFGEVITGGNAVNTAESKALAAAAAVGRARAQLQAGRKTQALTDANSVAAGFNYNVNYVDDASNRARLGNRVWELTLGGSAAISPPWRPADPRVKWRLPPAGLNPLDATYAVDRGAPFAVQDKYPAFNTPIRLASRIEADYIAAEAQGTSSMLALVQARRVANGLPAYAGPTDDASVLAEFEDQRGREFYLEGKRFGDLRRNGTAVRNTPVANAAYWKPGFAPIGSATCYPFPQREIDNNPNLRP